MLEAGGFRLDLTFNQHCQLMFQSEAEFLSPCKRLNVFFGFLKLKKIIFYLLRCKVLIDFGAKVVLL